MAKYVVTLKEMATKSAFIAEQRAIRSDRIILERPISRNTFVELNQQEAELLKLDDRILAVELHWSEIYTKPPIELYRRYNGTFTKQDGGNTGQKFQWGTLHTAGTVADRQNWDVGFDRNGDVTVDREGDNVDIIIADGLAPSNMGEWNNDAGTNRFVPFQWFNELNQFLGDDPQGNQLPTGTLAYFTNTELRARAGQLDATLFDFDGDDAINHGTHVSGTAAGRHYGWAVNANIYNLPLFGYFLNDGTPVPFDQVAIFDLAFDYVRVFHNNKGRNTPTIMNNSWGSSLQTPSSFDTLASVQTPEGTFNRPDGGWSPDVLSSDHRYTPSLPGLFGTFVGGIENPAMMADINDAIADGVIITGAAGNDDIYVAHPDSPWWNAKATYDDGTEVFYCRGTSPSNNKDYISVGALGANDNSQIAFFSQWGDGVDIWAPGQTIHSCMVMGVLQQDSKYGGDNYLRSISGTSMAAPQVCGILACAATNKKRFNQFDAINYLEKKGIKGEMFEGTDDDNYNHGNTQNPGFLGGAPNLQPSAAIPRAPSGVIVEEKFHRTSSSIKYPRTNNLYTNS